MTMNLLNLLAVQDGELKPHMLLGLRVDTRIPDSVWANYEKAKRLWQAEGLDADLFPDAMKPVDIAMSACRSVETRRGGDSDKTVEVAVDRVANSTQEVEYRITRKVRDKGSRDIRFHAAMNVNFNARAFDAGTNPWTVTPHEQEHYAQLRGLEERIKQVFTDRFGCLPSSKIRTAVREYLTRKDRMSAVNITRNTTSGYFVAIEHAGVLDSLERVVGALYGDNADFDILPLANSKGIREQIAKHAAFTTGDEAAQLLSEISERRKAGGTPRSDWLNNVATRARQLAEHNERLREKLGQEAQRSDVALELIGQQIMEMMTARTAVAA
jgi:hypothetical protein